MKHCRSRAICNIKKRFIAWRFFQPGQEGQNCLILKIKERRGSVILVASVVDLLFCCDFARSKLAMLRLCGTQIGTLCDSWLNRVRLIIRPFSTLSTLYDSWFDPVRIMIQPCSTLDSTLFDSWFDPVRLMIRLCSPPDRVRLSIRPCSNLSTHVRLMIRTGSTPDSTLFDSWFDPIRLMIRPYSTHESNLFDSIEPVRLMIRPCSSHDSILFAYSVHLTILVCDKNRTPFDSVGRIMSWTPQPGLRTKLLRIQPVLKCVIFFSKIGSKLQLKSASFWLSQLIRN